MNSIEPQPCPGRIEAAVAAFMRRLIAGGLTAEAVMARAWRDSRATDPTHELTWLSDLAPEAPAGWIRIRALDLHGRVLLDLVEGAERAASHSVVGAAHA